MVAGTSQYCTVRAWRVAFRKFDDWGDFWEDCEREERKSGSDDKTMMARPHVKIAQTSVTRATEPREGKEG